MKKMFSLGQAVKDIRRQNFSNSYFLYGNDIFMQDFFIKELKKIKKQSKTYLYYLGYDNQENIFNELSNLSLFESEKIIIIKNINRFTSQAKKDLLDYMSKKNSNSLLILVKNNFDSRSKFIDSIKNHSTSIDVRTPFEDKMEEWIKYFLKREEINVDNISIKDYINAYGSSISNVMNYIRIDFLSGIKTSNQIIRNYHIWHLQDSIGEKDINKSVIIFQSLLLNGNSINLILIYLFNFYKYMYNTFYNKKSNFKTFSINKIIQFRMNGYLKKYSKKEIENIFLKLKELDFLLKNSTLNINNAAICMLSNICVGYYER